MVNRVIIVSIRDGWWLLLEFWVSSNRGPANTTHGHRERLDFTSWLKVHTVPQSSVFCALHSGWTSRTSSFLCHVATLSGTGDLRQDSGGQG